MTYVQVMLVSFCWNSTQSEIQYSMNIQTFLTITLLFLNQTLWCDYSFESSLWDDSNEWSQHRVWLKKIAK